MNRNTNRSAQQTSNPKAECCTDSKCESGLRNNYFEGKRLTADSFRVEQEYQLARRRLLNRAIHGWGVVYGYGIVATDDDGCNEPGLKIGAGLALDECGRELLQNGTAIKLSDKLIVLSEDFKCIDYETAFAKAQPGDCWLLSVHYAEQKTAPVKVEDQCRCEHQEWDHICETVRYSLQKTDCAKCCSDFPCELECGCGTGPCCEEASDPNYSVQPDGEVSPHKRGGCNCLCKSLTDLSLKAECGHWCEIDEDCARVRVDVRNGVPLACVRIVGNDCGSWTLGSEVEACGPRRLVKRNDLLFDLIRGCDLTYIKEIGWADWHRKSNPSDPRLISFEEFQRALGEYDPSQDVFVSERFWVVFSRPVLAKSLLPDCFAMTVMSTEREGGWWQTFRVPIVAVDTSMIRPEAGDPEGYVRSARIVVDGPWLGDAVGGRRTIFLGGVTWVEFEVRGDFIVDCNGQTVDANAVGLSPVPTGNGTPGGTFLSTFSVDTALPEKYNRSAQNYGADPRKGV
jgi:hypothetical protein